MADWQLYPVFLGVPAVLAFISAALYEWRLYQRWQRDELEQAREHARLESQQEGT